MCQKCNENMRREYEEAKAAANEHMDSIGVPEDCITRDLALFTLACQAQPPLKTLIRELYPMPEQLLS